MANTSGLCNSFKLELMEGYHVLGAVNPARSANTGDTIMGALYYATGTLSASTTSYTTSNEVVGTGFTAGGTAVTNATGPVLYSNTATWNPSANLSWSTLTATAFDTVLLYNSTQSNRAILVSNFGSQTIVAGNFILTIPTPGAGTSLINIT